jgi:hypothetical protein
VLLSVPVLAEHSWMTLLSAIIVEWALRSLFSFENFSLSESQGPPHIALALDDQARLLTDSSVHTVSDLLSLKAVSFVCQAVSFVTRKNLSH